MAKLNFNFTAAAALVFLGAFAVPLCAQERVKDGDFAADPHPMFDPAFWTLSGNSAITFTDDASFVGANPTPSGDQFVAYFGEIGSLDSISQTLDPAPIGAYDLNFDLWNNLAMDGDPTMNTWQFQATFDGVNYLNLVDPLFDGWQHFSIPVVATTTTPTLVLSGRNDNFFLLASHISIAAPTSAVPEFGSVLSLGGLLTAGGVGLWVRRKRRK